LPGATNKVAVAHLWTSQALKYDVITYTPYEGPNYTIADKITPLRKRICEPPEVQMGCNRGDPGHLRHSG